MINLKYMQRALELAKQIQELDHQRGITINCEESLPIRSGIDYLVGYLESGVLWLEQKGENGIKT